MPSLRYFGHSACEIATDDARLLIDPFLTGNPLAPVTPDSLSPTAILLTHAHNDHVGDALEIARRSGATVVGLYELASWLGAQGVPCHGMNLGGGFSFPWGWVKLTPAWHSSTYQQGDQAITLGTPAGLLVRSGGRLLYHAGDTALFSDLALIGRHEIDLALIPIGDNFTMGPDDAVEAVRLLRPRRVVPIHYNTFPVIQQDPHAWAARVEVETGVSAEVLAPGDTIEY
jgi:L-ascorbate metabolism protein UlaG (beta-lactamase superfamily)